MLKYIIIFDNFTNVMPNIVKEIFEIFYNMRFEWEQ